MNYEELIEEGIVLEAKDGYANIAIIDKENCEDCSAKLFCKPGDGNVKTVDAVDALGAKPGDEVKISIRGKSLFNVSLLLYGFPLVIVIGLIFVGMDYFTDPKFKEFYSFVSALGVLIVYYVLLYFILYKKKNLTLPKIITIKRHQ